MADRIDQLTLQAESHREAAADLLRAADRAESEARRLSAYRNATETFTDDPRALVVLVRLAETWTGAGEQLVTVVREALRTVEDR